MDIPVPFSVQWAQGEEPGGFPDIPESQRNNGKSMFSLPPGHYTVMAVVRSRVSFHIMAWTGNSSRVLHVVPDSTSTRERQIMLAPLISTTPTNIRPERRQNVDFGANDLITLMFIPSALYSADLAGGGSLRKVLGAARNLVAGWVQ